MNNRNIIDKYVKLENVFNLCRLNLGKDYDSKKPTILIVDDYQAIIKLFERLVKKMKLEVNFNIVYSSHVDAGVKILNELYMNEDFHVDILITDITFGGKIDLGNGTRYNLNGIELVGILQEIFPELVYHFITGHIVNKQGTPNFFEEYAVYSDGALMDRLSYKDVPVSTNKDLIYNLVKGTRYEKLIR